ncbi:MAG: 2-nitropropane dioxygenase, partial [Deferribacterota bacterium]|nr:2-nitropropane dioxygenase [Deferribacterota bacterium]
MVENGSFDIIGSWQPKKNIPELKDYIEIINNVRKPVYVIRNMKTGILFPANEGNIDYSIDDNINYGLIGVLPPIYPEWLGDRSFTEVHNVRFPYVAGAMYRGITSVKMVTTMAKAGMLAFFGTAGFSPDKVESSVKEILDDIGDKNLSFGSNLIYSP